MKKVNFATPSSLVPGLCLTTSSGSIRMGPLLHPSIPCRMGVTVPKDCRISADCVIARMMGH